MATSQTSKQEELVAQQGSFDSKTDADCIGKMLYREVHDWIMSNDRGSGGSFLNLCGARQLSPERLRAELLADDMLKTQLAHEKISPLVLGLQGQRYG